VTQSVADLHRIFQNWKNLQLQYFECRSAYIQHKQPYCICSEGPESALPAKGLLNCERDCAPAANGSRVRRPTFQQIKCCTAHECQQSESCIAANGALVNGRLGPFASEVRPLTPKAGSRRSLQMQIHPYHSLGADIRLLPLNLAIFA